MSYLLDYIVPATPLLILLISVYIRSKGKTTDQKIDIILESLPEAKDKINLLLTKGKKDNAKKSDN